MKRIVLTTIAALALSAGYSQTEKTESDTTRLQLGNAKVLIIEDKKDSTDVDWTSEDNDDADSDKKSSLTYWAGVEVGVNMLRTPSGSLSMTGDNKWLDLDYGHSLSWKINFMEQKIRLVGDHVGLLIGAGVTWNSYGLQKNVNVVSNTTALKDTTFGIIDTVQAYSYSKNKIRMSYLNVPLMLEFNTSSDTEKNFHIALGAIGGWNMGTLTRKEWEYEGKSNNARLKGDFNATPFTLDLSARIGYRNFSVYGTYGLTPLFEKGKGPEVYPMSVGVCFHFS
jgi:Outer membrane protein beta-barrel domain